MQIVFIEELFFSYNPRNAVKFTAVLPDKILASLLITHSDDFRINKIWINDIRYLILPFEQAADSLTSVLIARALFSANLFRNTSTADDLGNKGRLPA